MEPWLQLAGMGAQAFGAWNANNNNMTMNSGAWKGDQVAAEAARLGVSPLAVLGGGGSSPTPMQNVAGGAAQFGQNLGRAITSQDPAADKLKKLQAQQLELQNQGLETDNAVKQLHLSTNAVSLGQPGAPPTRAPVDPNGNFIGPQQPFFTPGIEAGSTRYWVPDPANPGHFIVETARSKGKAESDFSGDYAGVISSTADHLMQAVPGAASILDFLNRSQDQRETGRPPLIRPDVYRTIMGGSAGASGSW